MEQEWGVCAPEVLERSTNKLIEGREVITYDDELSDMRRDVHWDLYRGNQGDNTYVYHVSTQTS